MAMPKVNKTQPKIACIRLKVSCEGHWANVPVLGGNEWKYWYEGEAWVKGLKSITLAKIKSPVLVGIWRERFFVYNHSGQLLEERPVPKINLRKFWRDTIREFRQGTRKELIRQAETNLGRLVASYESFR